MAKKTASKKTTKKKAAAKKTTAKKTAAKSSRAGSKKTTKKTAKKAGSKKTTVKKTSAKKTAKKSASKKTTAKKTSKKPAAKKTSAKKTTAKKTTAKKAGAKKTAKKSTSAKTSSKPAATESKDAKSGSGKKDEKSGRKGITIVNDRPARKSRPKKPAAPTAPPPGPRLLGPGSPIRKPLIPSGTRAEKPAEGSGDDAAGRKKKTPFNKRQLDKFKDILIGKRRELIGDVEKMETDALRSSSGGLSHTPQHLAEQGSDSADQSLSLNLAAADRRLIKEIDDALKRIADKTYGLCELTGEPINPERLEELPWARYSIKAAQQLERSGGHR